MSRRRRVRLISRGLGDEPPEALLQSVVDALPLHLVEQAAWVLGMKPSRAILYARVSTDQGEQDPEAQLVALRRWAVTRGWRVVSEETDQITSDPRRRRGQPPGLARALAAIERRKADVLAIFSADRLVADPIALILLVERVQDLGGAIASMEDGRDLDTTDDYSLMSVFMRGIFNRCRVKGIRRATVAGIAAYRAEGNAWGRPSKGVDGARVAELRAQGWSWSKIEQETGWKEGTAREALRRHQGQCARCGAQAGEPHQGWCR